MDFHVSDHRWLGIVGGFSHDQMLLLAGGRIRCYRRASLESGFECCADDKVVVLYLDHGIRPPGHLLKSRRSKEEILEGMRLTNERVVAKIRHKILKKSSRRNSSRTEE